MQGIKMSENKENISFENYEKNLKLQLERFRYSIDKYNPWTISNYKIIHVALHFYNSR